MIWGKTVKTALEAKSYIFFNNNRVHTEKIMV